MPLCWILHEAKASLTRVSSDTKDDVFRCDASGQTVRIDMTLISSPHQLDIKVVRKRIPWGRATAGRANSVVNLNIGVLGNRRDAAPLFEVTTASGKHAVGTVTGRPKKSKAARPPVMRVGLAAAPKPDKADTE